MREVYDRIYKVDNQGIKNTTYSRKFAFTGICAASVLEMERDEKRVGVLDELFNFEEASLDLKNYRNYHCAPFEDATIMTLICFDVVTTQAVDPIKSHIYMQGMCTMEIVRCHKSKVEGRLRLHQKWSY